jgi:ribosomal protein S12 methylthiotransferase accessory factor
VVAIALGSVHVNRGFEALNYRVDSPSHDALVELLSLYNVTGGPVRRIATYLGPGGGLRVNVGHCAYYDLDRIFQRFTGIPSLETGTDETLFGGGKGFTLHDMLVSSVGEGVERVVGSLALMMGNADQVFGTFKDMGARGLRCLSPEELPLFAAEQYADPEFFFEPYTEDSPLTWIEGERLLSGERVWLPAQLVEMLHLMHPDETAIGYSASGGLSCHVDRPHALFHGITELFERDAVNLRWYCGIQPEEIIIDRPPRSFQVRRLVEALEAFPDPVRHFQHSLDFPEVPVITTIQIASWVRSYAYSAGGGVDIDTERALQKAVTEFGQTERTLRMAILAPRRRVSAAVDQMFAIEPDAAMDKMSTFVQVIGYYGHRANHAKLDWYINGNPQVPLSELPSDGGASDEVRFEVLLDILRQHRIDPIVFDFSPPGMRQLKLMKVFVPELTQPFLQARPMLGHPRFHEIARAYGREPFTWTADPLPYP